MIKGWRDQSGQSDGGDGVPAGRGRAGGWSARAGGRVECAGGGGVGWGAAGGTGG
jgi:hypothetical protein